jgi:hypothetical protein
MTHPSPYVRAYEAGIKLAELDFRNKLADGPVSEEEWGDTPGLGYTLEDAGYKKRDGQRKVYNTGNYDDYVANFAPSREEDEGWSTRPGVRTNLDGQAEPGYSEYVRNDPTTSYRNPHREYIKEIRQSHPGITAQEPIVDTRTKFQVNEGPRIDETLNSDQPQSDVLAQGYAADSGMDARAAFEAQNRAELLAGRIDRDQYNDMMADAQPAPAPRAPAPRPPQHMAQDDEQFLTARGGYGQMAKALRADPRFTSQFGDDFSASQLSKALENKQYNRGAQISLSDIASRLRGGAPQAQAAAPAAAAAAAPAPQPAMTAAEFLGGEPATQYPPNALAQSKQPNYKGISPQTTMDSRFSPQFGSGAGQRLSPNQVGKAPKPPSFQAPKPPSFQAQNTTGPKKNKI